MLGWPKLPFGCYEITSDRRLMAFWCSTAPPDTCRCHAPPCTHRYLAGHTTGGMWLLFFFIQAPIIIVERVVLTALKRRGVIVPDFVRNAITVVLVLSTGQRFFWPPGVRYVLHAICTACDMYCDMYCKQAIRTPMCRRCQVWYRLTGRCLLPLNLYCPQCTAPCTAAKQHGIVGAAVESTRRGALAAAAAGRQFPGLTA